MPAPSLPRKRRRWFQFGLGSILIVTTAVCVSLAYWNTQVRDFRKQQKIAEDLKALGARIETRPWGPRFLQSLYGKEVLRDVVSVHLEHKHLRDRDLASLGELPRLQRLYLARTPVTDKGLEHVAALNKLQRLSLWGTRITDKGIGELAKVKSLQVLDIQRTRTSSQCLAHLQGHPNLTRLIHSLPIDDQAVRRLSMIPKLKCRVLRGNLVTDAGLNELAKLDGLEHLTLTSKTVTDAGLAALAKVRRLKHLTLVGANISGAGLPHLLNVKTLAELRLIRTSISLNALADQTGSKASQLQIRSNFRRNVIASTTCTFLLRGGKLTVIASERVADLSFLERMTALDTLEIQRPLSDTDFESLHRLRDLRVLTIVVPHRDPRRLPASRFIAEEVGEVPLNSPQALQSLRGLTGLRELKLSNLQLTDDHLAFLEDLTNLRKLDLSNNQMQGGGLVHMANLKQLESLDFSYCQRLDDDGLRHLQGLEKLKSVSLSFTRVTRAGLAKLKQLEQLQITTSLPTLNWDVSRGLPNGFSID